MEYSWEQIEQAVKSKGYIWFTDPTNKGYDLNIVSVRNSAPGDRVTNVFDDKLTVSYKLNGKWHYHEWDVTTDPGRKAVLEFSNSRGVAILVPGQYRGAYVIGKHKGQYDALKQDRPVSVYRDKNKDMKFDMDPATIMTGLFGINVHRSNPRTESVIVEDWSEGCTAFKRVRDFNEFMDLLYKAEKTYGNRFTYTLIESKDITRRKFRP